MKIPKPDIKVEDYITPFDSSQPFFIIHSLWFEKEKLGICFCERIDPRSWFYNIEKLSQQRFSDLEKLKSFHNKLVSEFDWRNKDGPVNNGLVQVGGEKLGS